VEADDASVLLDNRIENLTNQGRRMSVGPYRKGRNMDELVHVYWDGDTGRTGGWHACTEAEWFDLRVEPITNRAVPAKRVTLGRRFIDDHESRDLPFGIVVGENQRTYTLLMTADDIREVYSDADHYSNGAMDEWLEDDVDGYARSVIQAAGRVVEALRKQVPDVLV